MCSVFTNRKLKYHSAEDTIRSVLLQKPCVAFANSLLNVSLVRLCTLYSGAKCP
jgi:hypothetical protein